MRDTTLRAPWPAACTSPAAHSRRPRSSSLEPTCSHRCLMPSSSILSFSSVMPTRYACSRCPGIPPSQSVTPTDCDSLGSEGVLTVLFLGTQDQCCVDPHPGQRRVAILKAPDSWFSRPVRRLRRRAQPLTPKRGDRRTDTSISSKFTASIAGRPNTRIQPSSSPESPPEGTPLASPGKARWCGSRGEPRLPSGCRPISDRRSSIGWRLPIRCAPAPRSPPTTSPRASSPRSALPPGRSHLRLGTLPRGLGERTARREYKYVNRTGRRRTGGVEYMVPKRRGA